MNRFLSMGKAEMRSSYHTLVMEMIMKRDLLEVMISVTLLLAINCN